MEFDEKIKEFSDENLRKTQAMTVESYKRLNRYAVKGQILFTGSSLMEQFPITELAMSHCLGKIVYNRGVGGFKVPNLLKNIDAMLFDLEPKYLFINIGTNDLALQKDGSTWQENLKKNYDNVLVQVKRRLPDTRVFVMAYYPMDEANEEAAFLAKVFGSVRSNAALKEASLIAKELAVKYGYEFIDVNDGLTDETGNLKKEFCKDAIHFYPDGYEIVYKNLKKYLEACK